MIEIAGKSNSSLLEARKNKNDEFYTLYEDVAKGVELYKDYFKGKKVLCNCNDSEKSNFYKYFTDHFKDLELKELVCTTYAREGRGYKIRAFLDGEELKIEKTQLEGNGDFASEECIALLDECDIVCTNSPFSLFRKFIKLLEEHNKKYLVLGNLNTMITKEIFPLIKDGKAWVVPGKGSMNFETPEDGSA